MHTPADDASPESHPASRHVAPGTIAERWDALAGAGRVVARLAGEAGSAEGEEAAVASFAQRLHECDEQRRTLAGNAVADLSAMMEPGLAALMAIRAAGHDCTPAARALWQEYSSARRAALAILPVPAEEAPDRA